MKNLVMNERLKDNYDTYYDGTSQWRWINAITKVNNIVKLCESYPHKTILEIGSGEGSILKRLSQLHFADSLYSLEVAKTAIDAIAQRRIKLLKESRLFDGYSIPYEANSFDLVILSHVVEHLEYPRKLLYEAARVGRCLFIEVPLEDNLRLKNDFLYNKSGHINFYSFKTLRILVQTCNLDILTQLVTNPSFDTYKYRLGKRALAAYPLKEIFLRMLPLRLATSLWTYHCSLVCKKSEIIS